MTELHLESEIPAQDPFKPRIEGAVAEAVRRCPGVWRARIAAGHSGPGWWLVTLDADTFRWSLLVCARQDDADIRAALEAGLPRARPTATGRDRRRHPRFSVSFPVSLQWETSALGWEGSVTDDLGPGGAKVTTVRSAATAGEQLVVEVDDVFSVRAAVQGVSCGADGVSRLSLAFLDAEAADHVWKILGHDALA